MCLYVDNFQLPFSTWKFPLLADTIELRLRIDDQGMTNDEGDELQ